jgi:hypothetical protein
MNAISYLSILASTRVLTLVAMPLGPTSPSTSAKSLAMWFRLV